MCNVPVFELLIADLNSAEHKSACNEKLFVVLVVLLCGLDNLLSNVCGNIFIANKLTGEGTATLSHAAQVGCILEHFAQGSFRNNNGTLGSGVGADETATTAAHIAHDIAHVFVGNENFVTIDRFNKHGEAFAQAAL